MSLVISDEMIQRYYDEECGRILAPSRAVLDAAGAKYAVHRRIGPIAENIVEQAKQAQSDLICMGTRGMTPLANMVLGSVANRVLHLARIPVLLGRVNTNDHVCEILRGWKSPKRSTA
jgi:nucleotide-binding universal stress UspA family protein